jgi:hypothetical protein
VGTAATEDSGKAKLDEAGTGAAGEEEAMTQIPDYVTPIVGYRGWRWDSSRLLSLNNEPWLPGKPMTAKCTAVMPAAVRILVAKLKDSGMSSHEIERMLAHEIIRMAREQQQVPEHEAPLESCTCGIYAFKAPKKLLGAANIYGEVYLWGKVVEHKYGWRAQYAYPKSFEFRIYPESGLSAEDAEAQLKQLTARFGIRARISLVERYLVTVRGYGLPIGFDVRESGEGQILGCRINHPDVELEP